MATCGICQRMQFLIAIFIDGMGKVHPPLGIGRTDEDRQWLLEHLEETEGRYELVLSERLLRSDSIGLLGLQRGSVVWSAPHWLLEAIASASWKTAIPPDRQAAILARLPLIPALRPFLRRLQQGADHRQLALL